MVCIDCGNKSLRPLCDNCRIIRARTQSYADYVEQQAGHSPANYHGRTVCTCGDFNCASLDYPR